MQPKKCHICSNMQFHLAESESHPQHSDISATLTPEGVIKALRIIIQATELMSQQPNGRIR
jgi:hypothetical protein